MITIKIKNTIIDYSKVCSIGVVGGSIDVLFDNGTYHCIGCGDADDALATFNLFVKSLMSILEG